MTMIISGDNGLTYPNSTTQASAGVVLQVVNATYSTSTGTSSLTYVDSGLSATITPKFATSKILVIAQCTGFNYSASATSNLNYQLVRNSTAIYTPPTYSQYVNTGGSSAQLIVTSTLTFLDSPATTSATTYKLQINVANASYTATAQYGNAPSVITLMEIAG